MYLTWVRLDDPYCWDIPPIHWPAFRSSNFIDLHFQTWHCCVEEHPTPPKWKIILESTLFQFGFQTIFYIILYVPIWFDALPQGKPRDFCFFLRGCLFSLEKTIGTLMTIIQAKGEAGLEIFRHCRWPCQGEGKEGEILRIWGQAKGILYLVWSNLVGVTTFRTARLVLEASCFSCLFLRNIMNDMGMVLDLWKNDHFSWAIVWAFFTALCDIQDGLRKSPLRKGRWSIYIYIYMHKNSYMTELHFVF